MLKDMPVQRGRYAELEGDLKGKTSKYGNLHDLKNSVITADNYAYLGYVPIPPYKAVAGRLKLNISAVEELKGLYYEVIDPVRIELHNIQRKFIGVKHWFDLGSSLRPDREVTDSMRIRSMMEFTDFFFGLMNKNGLGDRKAIKKAIIYPLTVSQITEWDSSGEQAKRLISTLISLIKAREENPELRDMIDAIYNSARRRV